jgi:hypothetical protein
MVLITSLSRVIALHRRDTYYYVRASDEELIRIEYCSLYVQQVYVLLYVLVFLDSFV